MADRLHFLENLLNLRAWEYTPHEMPSLWCNQLSDFADQAVGSSAAAAASISRALPHLPRTGLHGPDAGPESSPGGKSSPHGREGQEEHGKLIEAEALALLT